MAIATHVSDLGIPSNDGAIAPIRLGKGTPHQRDVLLEWQASPGVWSSKQKISISTTSSRMLFTLGAASGWSYLASADSTAYDYGSSLRAIHHPDEYYAAGLSLQERLTGYLYASSGIAPKVAVNWYEFNGGEEISQLITPGSVGVQLIGDPHIRRFISSGWQNSPVAIPVKEWWYPDFYVEMASLGGAYDGVAQNLLAEYRWAGGAVGSLGGSDDSKRQPPAVSTGNLLLRYVADLIPVANGAPVSKWLDEGGSSDHLQQATGANQPVVVRNVLNGHSVVRFDGVNDFLQGSSNIPQPTTIFIVLKQYAAGATTQIWIDGQQSSARNAIYRFDAVNQISYYAGSADVLYSRASAWPSPYMCMSAVFNGSSSSIWENKVQKAIGNPGSEAFSGPTIGAVFDGTLYYATIDVAEILVYSGALSDADRDAVTDWLNSYYSLY